MVFLSGDFEEQAKFWMYQAAEQAELALCARAKCGTVIVSGGKAIGLGYNAPALDSEENRMCGDDFVPGKPRYDKTCCIHAEWRAIMDALTRHADRIAGSTLYFTRVDAGGGILKAGQPFCTVCSRLALDSGIATFVLWQEAGLAAYETQEYNRVSYEYRHEV
jgi:deoxycytidylate deaminase